MKKALIILSSIVILAIIAVIIFPYVDPYSRRNYMKRAKDKHPSLLDYTQKMEKYRADTIAYNNAIISMNENFNRLVANNSFDIISVKSKFDANPVAFRKNFEENPLFIMTGTINEIIYGTEYGIVFSNENVVVHFISSKEEILKLEVGEIVDFIGLLTYTAEVEPSKLKETIEEKKNDSKNTEKIERTTMIGDEYLFLRAESSTLYNRERKLSELIPQYKYMEKPVEPIKPDIKIDGSWESLSKQ